MCIKSYNNVHWREAMCPAAGEVIWSQSSFDMNANQTFPPHYIYLQAFVATVLSDDRRKSSRGLFTCHQSSGCIFQHPKAWHAIYTHVWECIATSYLFFTRRVYLSYRFAVIATAVKLYSIPIYCAVHNVNYRTR